MDIKALLAEDDFEDYLLFVEAFEKVSPAYKISWVKNGLDCITCLKGNKVPDIIFLDLNMPYKNGLECLQYIKSTESLAHLPVVIFSTSHYIKHIDIAYKSRADFYIVKPAGVGQLEAILATVLDKLARGAERATKENFVVRLSKVFHG